jgi:hypothetical protein
MSFSYQTVETVEQTCTSAKYTLAPALPTQTKCPSHIPLLQQVLLSLVCPYKYVLHFITTQMFLSVFLCIFHLNDFIIIVSPSVPTNNFAYIFPFFNLDVFLPLTANKMSKNSSAPLPQIQLKWLRILSCFITKIWDPYPIQSLKVNSYRGFYLDVMK